jgi:hypothetical protein
MELRVSIPEGGKWSEIVVVIRRMVIEGAYGVDTGVAIDQTVLE